MNHHLQSRWKPLAGGGRKRFGSSGHGFRNVGHVKKKIRPTQRKCRFRSHSPLIKRRERERLSSGGRLIVVSCGVPLPTRSLSRWARASFHERSRPGMAAFFAFCCFCSRERERGSLSPSLGRGKRPRTGESVLVFVGTFVCVCVLVRNSRGQRTWREKVRVGRRKRRECRAGGWRTLRSFSRRKEKKTPSGLRGRRWRARKSQQSALVVRIKDK